MCLCLCASVCNRLSMSSFWEEITHGWFYSVLRRTSGEDSRRQGSTYHHHLLSRWETLDRELLWGLLSLQEAKAELILTFSQYSMAALMPLETCDLFCLTLSNVRQKQAKGDFFNTMKQEISVEVRRDVNEWLYRKSNWNRWLPPFYQYNNNQKNLFYLFLCE